MSSALLSDLTHLSTPCRTAAADTVARPRDGDDGMGCVCVTREREDGLVRRGRGLTSVSSKKNVGVRARSSFSLPLNSQTHRPRRTRGPRTRPRSSLDGAQPRLVGGPRASRAGHEAREEEGALPSPSGPSVYPTSGAAPATTAHKHAAARPPCATRPAAVLRARAERFARAHGQPVGQSSTTMSTARVAAPLARPPATMAQVISPSSARTAGDVGAGVVPASSGGACDAAAAAGDEVASSGRRRATMPYVDEDGGSGVGAKKGPVFCWDV